MNSKNLKIINESLIQNKFFSFFSKKKKKKKKKKKSLKKKTKKKIYKASNKGIKCNLN